MRPLTGSKLTSSKFYPWLVWGLAASFFFAEYFARVGPSVMAQDLMRDFHVGPFSLGTLSAFFLYPYVAMQLPVGVLVDKFGPHRLLSVAAAFSALACSLFALSHSLFAAELSRLILGFAASFAFVGALKLATMWFPPEKLGLLAGLTQGLGMLGAAAGEGPFAGFVKYIGWRETMFLISGVLLMIAIAIGLFVRDRINTSYLDMGVNLNAKLPKRSVLESIDAVIRNKQTWANAFFIGLLYAPIASFGELWGTSFLRVSYSLSNEMAATGISCMFIGWFIGSPIVGWISDTIRRRRILMLLSAVFCCVISAVIIFVPHLPIPVLFILLFLFGVSNTGVSISYAVAGEINPRFSAGFSIAVANMASVIIGAFLQPMIGWLIEHHWTGQTLKGVPVYSAADYRFALGILPILLLIACGAVFLVKETHCKSQELPHE